MSVNKSVSGTCFTTNVLTFVRRPQIPQWSILLLEVKGEDIGSDGVGWGGGSLWTPTAKPRDDVNVVRLRHTSSMQVTRRRRLKPKGW